MLVEPPRPGAAGVEPGTPETLMGINTIGHREDVCVGLGQVILPVAPFVCSINDLIDLKMDLGGF